MIEVRDKASYGSVCRVKVHVYVEVLCFTNFSPLLLLYTSDLFGRVLKLKRFLKLIVESSVATKQGTFE